MNLIRNLFGHQLVKSTKKSGPFGKLAKLGLARRVASKRTLGGRLVRGRVTAKKAGMGLGILAGLGALVAGSIFGVRRLTTSRSDSNY